MNTVLTFFNLRNIRPHLSEIDAVSIMYECKHIQEELKNPPMVTII